MLKTRKWGCVFLAIILLFCGVYINIDNIASAATVTVYKVNGTGVALRSEPSTSKGSETVITRISNVEVTYISETKQGNYTWYYVKYNGQSGYIRGDYIKIETYTTDDSFESTLALFPESYREGLIKLHAQYPNWKFTADQVNMTFDAAVALQDGDMRKQVGPSSAISTRSMGPGSYDWATKEYATSNEGWYGASREMIRYYMDPRNFLTPTEIIMYLQQSYDSKNQTADGVATIIKGTFLEKNYTGGNYTDDIMAAAAASGVSPYVLASIIVQEQGVEGKSDLISGNYAGYQGYYNFFNVGASGSDGEVTKNGLAYAQAKGWNSRRAAIIGGAQTYASGYIKAGQDTYFYKNYNVLKPSDIWHQYAQNVADSYSTASINAKVYTENKSATLTFRIPVYRDMPASTVKPENSSKQNNYYFTGINAGSGLAPSFNKFTYDYTLQVTGNTTIGVTVPDGATYTGNNSYSLKAGDNKVSLTVKSETGFTNTYVITVNSPAAATLKVEVNGGFKEEAKKGDVNADGKISLSDLAGVQMHLLGVKTIDATKQVCADINGDGKISLSDLAAIQMHLLGVKLIG